jgi:hypothetical protein
VIIRRARDGLLRAAVGLAAGATLLAACTGGSSTLTDPDDVPPRHRGPATDVDACQLIPAADAASALARPMRTVGMEYGPSRVPTFRCLLGDEFGVAQLTVELAVGPVSRNVFFDAYGERAGGDPTPVKRLGGMALLRNEKDERSLHVYVRGTIFSLRLVQDPARPVGRLALLDLARAAVARLPSDPRLAGTDPGRRCSRVPPRLVGAVIGVEPARASGFEGDNGSVMCSWASFPGSVDVTVIADPAQVREYRQTLDASAYLDVTGMGAGTTALSRANRPGDLLIFDGRRSMAVISAVPAAGYPNPSIITTQDEVALGRAVVSALM